MTLSPWYAGWLAAPASRALTLRLEIFSTVLALLSHDQLQESRGYPHGRSSKADPTRKRASSGATGQDRSAQQVSLVESTQDSALVDVNSRAKRSADSALDSPPSDDYRLLAMAPKHHLAPPPTDHSSSFNAMPAAFYDTFLAQTGRKVCPACRRRLALRVPAAPCFARALTTSCRILKNAEASMCVAYLPVPFPLQPLSVLQSPSADFPTCRLCLEDTQGSVHIESSVLNSEVQ